LRNQTKGFSYKGFEYRAFGVKIFINMKKLYLEFIRGAAAVTVLVYHFLELQTLSRHSKHFYFANWGTDAVIIFFILSGVVINISQTNNPKPKGQFIGNRLLRIYPQLAAGILLGLLVLYITQADIPSMGTIAGNFFMISAVKGYMVNIVPCIESNSPLWSISYEIVFYLLFALSIGKFQKKAVITWFIISLAIMPVYYLQIGPDFIKHFVWILAFSSIWLAGYYIYEYRNYFYADKYTALFSAGALPLISRMHIASVYYDPAKYLLFAIFAIPFFRFCLQTPKVGKKINLYYMALPYLAIVYVVFNQPYLTFTSFLLYSLLPLALMGICLMIDVLKIKAGVINFINRTGKVLGKYSFSIYISHYPVLFFFAAFVHNPVINLSLSVACIAIIVYALETYLQPAVVNYFRPQACSQSPAFSFRVWLKPAFELVLIKRIIISLVTMVAWLLLLPFHDR
jgi:peptidoglycan/LPS O-acetylase OafA/YrhL